MSLIQIPVNKLSIEAKLYVWSIVLEPLLFLILSGALFSGIHISVARIIQCIFLIMFFLRVSTKNKHCIVPNPISHNYCYITAYFCLLVISSFIGLLYGGSYILTNIDESYKSVYALRLPFEFIILIYYILYFVVLPQYILDSREKIKYLFDCIEIIFYLGVVVGLLDLFFSYFDLAFIPRHYVDGEEAVYVGTRFHGFAGEPRDAFVYLIFGYMILLIKSEVFKKENFKFLLPVVLLCIVLTQSGSGFLGIAIGSLLYLLFNFSVLKTKGILALTLVLLVTVLSVSQTDRLKDYYDLIIDIKEIISSGGELPFLIKVQSNNIFPLWSIYQKISNFDLLTVFFGSGIGSSAVLNSNLGDFFGNEIVNPHAQITRILFEGGILGFTLYVYFFYKIFKTFIKGISLKSKNYYTIIYFMFLGSSLAHRSTAIFVFTGIIFALLRIRKNDNLLER